MQYLTNEQIDLIVSEVNNAEITFSHLKDDLIDHLCCEVEAEVRRGLSFNDAFSKMQKNVGAKNLKKVQENTLLLIDKNYRLMKKTMKISGLVSMALIAFGTLFKIMHWPGASPLLVFGFVFVSLLFFPTAMWVMKKESKLKSPVILYLFGFLGGFFILIGFLFKIMHWPGASVALLAGYSSFILLFMPILLYSLVKSTNQKSLKTAYILGFISFILCLMGQYFKVMHWPGAAIMIISGSVLLVSLFLPYYAFIKFKDTKSVQGSFLFLSIGILLFTIFNNLIALNVSGSILAQFNKPIQRIVEINTDIEKNNNATYKSILNDSLKLNTELRKNLSEIQNESNELCRFITDIKLDIISKVDKVDKKQAKPNSLMFKDNTDITMEILMGTGEKDNEFGKAKELKTKIEKYKIHLLSLLKENNSTIILIANLLNTDDRYNPKLGYKVTWEKDLFFNAIAISSLYTLSHIEMNVRLVESEVIKELISAQKAKNLASITINSSIK